MADNAISSTPVGEVVNLTGQAQAISGSEVRDLSPGSPVYQGDTIVTNQGSQLEIDFIDDTSFSQGENSRSEINSYVYDPDDASGSGLLFELSKGVFRTVTGEIAKQNPDNFNLKSPMALIGIRGTVVNSDIQEGFEKIGVETIGKGHVLVIQDSQGNVQFISDPLKIMEIIQGQPLGTARDMTRQEVRDFQNFAPNSIDNNLDRRGELESRLNAAEAEARAEEAAEAAEEAEEAAAREAAEAAEAEAEAAEAAAAAEEAAREAEEAEAVLKAAEEAGDAEALALAQEAVQQAAQAAAQAQAKAAEAAEAAGRQVQAAQEAARLAQELADLKTAAQIEAEQKAAEIIEAPENTNPQTNTWTDTNRSDVLGVIEVDSQGQTKYYAATDTTTKDNGQPQQEEEDDQLVKQEEQEQNNAPAAKTDKAATDEDTPVTINVLANDTDADGDALAVDSVTQGSHGKVSITSGGGDVIYSPDSKYNGEDSFTYTVRDGNGGTSTATVNVTVNAVNDDPVANDDTKTIQKGTTHVTIDVLANDTDVDGDALVIDSVTQGSHGEVFITNDGSDVTYTPDPDYYGEDIFTYTVSDGKGGTATASVVIQINDGPVAENDEAVTDEDTPVVIDVLANDTDADGDSLAVDSVTQGAYGEVSITSGGSDVTYTPDPDYNGEDSFTYIVSDGNGGTAEATVYVMVEETDEEIWGTDGDDTLYGLSGDDTIYGLGGDDRLYGDDPDDQNVEGNDVLYGGSGDDTLEGGPGSDQLDGGDETLIDIATYQNDPQGIFVTMGSPVSVQDGWGGTDTLTDIEYIRGSDSGDSFSGDGRDMVYEGGGGNDTIDGGTQEYDGGATVSYWNDPVNPGDPGISVDLNDVNEDGYVWVTDGYSDTDRLKHITGVVGSAGNDTLTGVDNEFNFFMGLQGDDFIDGGAFSGNDPDNSAGYLKDPAAIVAHVYYNLTKSNPFEGSYVEDGWGYTDTLVNITGIEGSAYDDQITFDIYDPDNTSDIWWDVWGMAGADTITGTSGENVTASYEDDPSGVNVDLSTGTAVDGWGDTDTLIDIQGVDGSEFNDTIKGNSFDNYLEGEEGDDLIEGIGGDNFLEGGPGNDTLTGGAGSDFFEPGTGNDSVSGGGDWDHVSYSWIDDETFNGVTIDLASGTATGRDSYGDLLFTDTLAGIEGATGSEYDDNITGNMEDNYFGGTEGNDSLDGGDGWDHVSYEWIDSDSFYGIDIDLASGTATGRDSYGDLLFTDTLTSIEGITGSEYDDTIQGGSPTEYLSGGHGNDQITGGEGDEFLDGGAGNDTLTGGPGWDMLQGGDGSDTFVFTHSQSTDTIEDFQVTSDVIRFQETELGFSADGGYAFYTASSEDQHSPLDKQIMGVTDTVSDWADAADALNNVLNGYGSGDDDDTYFVLSNGTDARVYYWDGDADSSGTLDDSELVHLADLNGVTDGDIGSMTASNFEIDQTPV